MTAHTLPAQLENDSKDAADDCEGLQTDQMGNIQHRTVRRPARKKGPRLVLSELTQRQAAAASLMQSRQRAQLLQTRHALMLLPSHALTGIAQQKQERRQYEIP